MYQSLRIVLNISTYELEKYYGGKADCVVASATDGRIIKFPANILRSVVKSNGVHGTFELIFNEHHKFISINRISSS